MVMVRSAGPDVPMSPATALARAVHLLDRSLASPYKTRAFSRALETVTATDPVDLAERARDGKLAELDGLGDTTATVVSEALAGKVPAYVSALEDAWTAELASIGLDAAGHELVEGLRGDCHLHSTWSDGGAEIADMAQAAIELGHDYMVLTDHSARLTVAHGLDETRLAQQLDVIDALNADLSDRGVDFRILTGMEVDILEDGALDLSSQMLARLDVVVASVHSKLKMDRDAMTKRMVAAVANPHVDILGHLTGRKVGKRPPSTFDADFVFAACAAHHTAVEINCRPERLDPPRELIDLAIEYGCWFSIDSDAHATGQLEWKPYGCARAVERGVPAERIINTMTADELRDWTHG